MTTRVIGKSKGPVADRRENYEEAICATDRPIRFPGDAAGPGYETAKASFAVPANWPNLRCYSIVRELDYRVLVNG